MTTFGLLWWPKWTHGVCVLSSTGFQTHCAQLIEDCTRAIQLKCTRSTLISQNVQPSYQPFRRKNNKQMKIALREMQTLCAGSSNAEPQIFAPPQTHFPWAQDRQNLISWRWSLPAPTDPVWWRSMDAISSYRGNRHRPPTHPPVRPPHTHRQDWLQYTALQLASAQCNKYVYGPISKTARVSQYQHHKKELIIKGLSIS